MSREQQRFPFVKKLIDLCAADRSHRGLGSPYISAGNIDGGMPVKQLQGKIVRIVEATEKHFVLEDIDMEQPMAKKKTKKKKSMKWSY